MIKTIRHNLAIKLDSVGFFASTLCAIHCMAMPFAIIFLTVYGLQFIANPVFEVTFILTSVVIGVFTFRHGYLNHHRKLYPFFLFLGGLLIVVLGHVIFDHDSHTQSQAQSTLLFLMVAPAGALMIGIAHFLNRKLSKKSTRPSCDCKSK